MSLEYYTRNLDQLGYPGQTGTPHNLVLDKSFSDEGDAFVSGGGILTLTYTATGGEDSFQDDDLINATVISVTRDGLNYTPVDSFSGTTKKEFIHDEETGEINYHTGLPAMEPGEDNVVIYVPSGAATATAEPITLAQAKKWLKVTHDDEDDIISSLITVARKICENCTNKSFIPRTVTAIVRNDLGNVRLPYGPVNTVLNVYDIDGTEITSGGGYLVTGILDKRLAYPISSYVKVVYTAGYAALPEDFKQGLRAQLAWCYVHRGDEDIKLISPEAKAILSPYMINKA